jgi:hypothetical protein
MLGGLTDPVIGLVALSQDGQRLFIASGATAQVLLIFPNTQALVDYAKIVALRCLTDDQQIEFFLDQAPPDWCYKMEKWPYKSRRFGVSVRDISDEMRLKLKLENVPGILAFEVLKGLLADTSGLTVGDVIIALDGVPIENTQAFIEILDKTNPDQSNRRYRRVEPKQQDHRKVSPSNRVVAISTYLPAECQADRSLRSVLS